MPCHRSSDRCGPSCLAGRSFLWGRYRADRWNGSFPCHAACLGASPSMAWSLGPGQIIGPWAGPSGHGLHGHVYPCMRCSFGIFAPISACVHSRKLWVVVQSKRTCLIDSSYRPHRLQFSTSSICLLWRTSLSGKKPFTNHHQKTKTFGATLVICI